MKPHEGNTEAISEYLTYLHTLERSEGYQYLMAQIDDLTRTSFGKLMAATDPTTMAKEVGRTDALREVRSWVSREIQAFMEADAEGKKPKK